MSGNKRLGRGLGALIPEGGSNNKNSVRKIKVELIKPNNDQPRKEFNEEKLMELQNSIDEYGIIQPIVVRSVSHGYEIIVGERRWRAAMNLGMDEIPVIIKDVDDFVMSKLALIENIQREDLNRVEEANGYNQLIEEYDVTQTELANIVGKSRSYISNILRILKLDCEIQEKLITNELTNGHCKALLGLEGKEARLKVMNKIIEEDLSVRATEEYIRRVNQPTEVRKAKYRPPKEILYYENDLKEKFSTKVKIKHKKSNKGKIEIEYYSIDDLNRILNQL